MSEHLNQDMYLFQFTVYNNGYVCLCQLDHVVKINNQLMCLQLVLTNYICLLPTFNKRTTRLSNG